MKTTTTVDTVNKNIFKNNGLNIFNNYLVYTRYNIQFCKLYLINNKINVYIIYRYQWFEMFEQVR